MTKEKEDNIIKFVVDFNNTETREEARKLYDKFVNSYISNRGARNKIFVNSALNKTETDIDKAEQAEFFDEVVPRIWSLITHKILWMLEKGE